MPPLPWCKYHLLPEVSSVCFFLQAGINQFLCSKVIARHLHSPRAVSFSTENCMFLREGAVSVSLLHLKERSIQCHTSINYSIKFGWVNQSLSNVPCEWGLPESQILELGNHSFPFFAPNCPKDSGLFTTGTLSVLGTVPNAMCTGESAEGWLGSFRSLLTLLSWVVLVQSHVEARFLGDLDDAELTQPSPGDAVASVIWGGGWSLHQHWVAKARLRARRWVHSRAWADAPALCAGQSATAGWPESEAAVALGHSRA